MKLLTDNLPFLKSVSIFTAANLLNAAIPFLLLPLLTKYLTPTDFGIVAMFQVLGNLFLPLTGVNVESAVSRYYFEREKISFPSFVMNALYIVAASSTILFLLMFVGGTPIGQLTFGADAARVGSIWLLLVIVMSLGQNLMQVQLSIWQMQKKALKFGLLRVSKTLVEVGLSVFLVIEINRTWEGRMEAQLISVILFSLLALFFLFSGGYLKAGLNKDYVKKILLYGSPLIIHTLSGVILSYSDRIFITTMVSIADTGLYSVGYQVGMIISLFCSSFNQAWVPWLFEKLKQDNQKVKLKIVKFTYLYFIVIWLVVIVLVLAAPLIFEIFIGEDFSSGLQFVFWIALGFGLNGMYMMMVNYIFYLNKTYIIALVTGSSALLNLLLNYLLIKMNGVIGAAQATAISLFVAFVAVWAASAILYKMPWFYFLKTNPKSVEN